MIVYFTHKQLKMLESFAKKDKSKYHEGHTYCKGITFYKGKAL